jgi:hypothetical protein
LIFFHFFHLFLLSITFVVSILRFPLGFERRVISRNPLILYLLSNQIVVPARLNRCRSLPRIVIRSVQSFFRLLHLWVDAPSPRPLPSGERGRVRGGQTKKAAIRRHWLRIAARLSKSLTSRDITLSLDPDYSDWTEF